MFLLLLLFSFNYPRYIRLWSPGFAKLEMTADRHTQPPLQLQSWPPGEMSLWIWGPQPNFKKQETAGSHWSVFTFLPEFKKQFPPKVSDSTWWQLLELVPLAPAYYILIQLQQINTLPRKGNLWNFLGPSLPHPPPNHSYSDHGDLCALVKEVPDLGAHFFPGFDQLPKALQLFKSWVGLKPDRDRQRQEQGGKTWGRTFDCTFPMSVTSPQCLGKAFQGSVFTS